MKDKNLLILGAGQYGRVARETADTMGCFERIDFLDDNSPLAIGRLADYERFAQSYGSAFVAMGNPQLRIQWLNKLDTAGFELPVLIHSKAYVSPSAVIGPGSIVEPMAVVNTEAVIEKGGLICAGCVVNHNARVMAGCQIDCGVAIASNAIVPEGTKVQSNILFKSE